MSEDSAERPIQARHDIENMLLAEVERCAAALRQANSADRTVARDRFAVALLKFNDFIVHGKLPKEANRFTG
jgi:hypothetical protein